MVVFNPTQGMARDGYDFEYFTTLRNASKYFFNYFVKACQNGIMQSKIIGYQENRKNPSCKDSDRDFADKYCYGCIYLETFNVYVPPISYLSSISETEVLSLSDILKSDKIFNGRTTPARNTTSVRRTRTSSDIIKSFVNTEYAVREEFTNIINIIHRNIKLARNVIDNIDNIIDNDNNSQKGKPFRALYTNVVLEDSKKYALSDSLELVKGNRLFIFDAYNERYEVKCNDNECFYNRDTYKVSNKDTYKVSNLELNKYSYEDYMGLERFISNMKYIADNLWVEIIGYDSENDVCKVMIGVRGVVGKDE